MATAFASVDVNPAYAYGVPNMLEALKTWTMPSSYPTGGIDIAAACAEFDEVIDVRVCLASGSNPSGYVLMLTGTLGTYGVTVATALLFASYDTDPAAGGGANVEFVQVTNTDDMSSTLTTCRVLVRGYKA